MADWPRSSEWKVAKLESYDFSKEKKIEAAWCVSA
jgi:hypothetical protein